MLTSWFSIWFCFLRQSHLVAHIALEFEIPLPQSVGMSSVLHHAQKFLSLVIAPAGSPAKSGEGPAERHLHICLCF